MDTSNMSAVPVQGGAEYAMVHERVKAFCGTYANGQILTEIVKDNAGHVIFKAHAVVDNIIRGTGHAHELEGSTNINNTSHYEACETSAVGRALAFMGYSPDGGLASYEEIENAKIQQSQVGLHKKTLDVASAYVSKAFINAIETNDEEQILECQKDMGGNELLHQGVNETLSSSEKEYMIDRFNKHREEREIRQEKREARNRVYAKEFAEKQMKKKKNLNG